MNFPFSCGIDVAEINEKISFDCKITIRSVHIKVGTATNLRELGLRYEVGLNNRTGNMVWAFGGYTCGLYPDLSLTREDYIHSVRRGERTMADMEYEDDT